MTAASLMAYRQTGIVLRAAAASQAKQHKLTALCLIQSRLITAGDRLGDRSKKMQDIGG